MCKANVGINAKIEPDNFKKLETVQKVNNKYIFSSILVKRSCIADFL